ncbi:hypothetical protein DJ021_08635 [Phenylobacterium hankyongense]|uniref:Antibiotic biosynthesis monooxygenase n=1 Tax=Phenylobacterium hankyongense TaxID=1813876 RepID=A0A328AZ50_9CAUL|nr:hypothetical protein [Phenylobacterium hankyongense]RAK59867.1 hypothetical protein DJ021_08635 [Phenylobacterium hankyongense]
MYVITRRFQSMSSVAEAAARAEAGLAPMLVAATGFKGYHIIDAGGGVGLSVTMFETREDADRVKDRALDWIRQNLSDLYQGEPEVTAGEVIYSARPETMGGREASSVQTEARPH